MVKVAVAGCAGRMGQRIVCAVDQSAIVGLGAGFEKKGHGAVGKDIGFVAGIEEKKITIGDSVNVATGCGAIIDFTAADATEANVAFARKQGINMVIGTTGFAEAQKQAISQAARDIAIVFAPNFGVGINVLLNVVKRVASVVGSSFDIEVIEAHHNKKKDAPSGTALGLAEAAAAGLKISLKDHAVYGRQGNVGARKQNEIGIHAIRGGDIIGEHTVMFAGSGEKIEISHSVVTRDVLAQGAVRAAEFLCEKKSGLFDMQDVLGLK